jgi:hypothetical protein
MQDFMFSISRFSEACKYFIEIKGGLLYNETRDSWIQNGSKAAKRIVSQSGRRMKGKKEKQKGSKKYEFRIIGKAGHPPILDRRYKKVPREVPG